MRKKPLKTLEVIHSYILKFGELPTVQYLMHKLDMAKNAVLNHLRTLHSSGKLVYDAGKIVKCNVDAPYVTQESGINWLSVKLV